MNQPCENCPFAASGPGLRLRQSLRPGRWREILLSVRLGQPFFCHKTTNWDAQDEEGDSYIPQGKEQICAGSIEYLRNQPRRAR